MAMRAVLHVARPFNLSKRSVLTQRVLSLSFEYQ